MQTPSGLHCLQLVGQLVEQDPAAEQVAHPRSHSNLFIYIYIILLYI